MNEFHREIPELDFRRYIENFHFQRERKDYSQHWSMKLKPSASFRQ